MKRLNSIKITSGTQMSDSFAIGITLAIAGGFMDAYSYMFRGHVFANAQTGNILLLGVNLSQLKWGEALNYFFPVASFVIGIAIADFLKIKFKEVSALHWRQISVLFEIIILIGVCFVPQSMNMFANCLTSLVCGIQLETFRKIHGNSIATTMCIGNIRSGTQFVCEYMSTRELYKLRKGFLYYGIILFFVIGAVIGNMMINYMGQFAMIICAVVLLAAFAMMFIEKRKEQV